MSFYVFKADDINLYVVNSEGAIVDQVADNFHVPPKKRVNFFWNGRNSNGTIVPDGEYRFRIALTHEDRSAPIGGPITVDTVPPRPRVTSVTPHLIAGSEKVAINVTGNAPFGGDVLLYRTDVPGKPQLVKTFRVGKTAVWDGTIHQLPAPAGVYLAGFKVADKACNIGSFPIGGLPLAQDPPPGTTPHAGVTVRYLAAEPPLAPVPAGSRALVYVDSRERPYRWTLSQFGVRKPVSHGTGHSFALHVRLPATGLYRLSIASGSHTTEVPLLASIPPGSPHARILVVLPALTWQGLNPVDDNGDGLPDTLAANVPIELARPYANGMPVGVGNEAALLGYLDRHHLRYDLTTDVALAQGANPGLTGRRAVVFAGNERWLPASLGPRLRTFAQNGGRVVSLGTDSLRRTAVITQTPQGLMAARPSAAAATDLFGARLGSVVAQRHPLLTLVIPPDRLRLFSQTSGAFTGFNAYQPVTSLTAPAKMLSSAGVSPQSPSIAAFRYGHGLVVDVGLIGFEQSIRHNVDSQAFVDRLWAVLAK
jgi:N,N-dimethylformamidase beta subunit-like protein